MDKIIFELTCIEENLELLYKAHMEELPDANKLTPSVLYNTIKNLEAQIADLSKF